MCIYFDDVRGVCQLREKHLSNSEKYVPKPFMWDYCKASSDWKAKECPTYKRYG